MSSRPYNFNQETFENLYDLSRAYIAHFDEAIEDVSNNGKELARFIKSRVNDKAKYKQYVSIFEDTKYASNVVTFLIFEMSDHKDIYISGVKMDLLTYLQALRENPDPANNILFGFLEDGGISKTFTVFGADNKLCKHSKAIEKNYRNPFTYKYLVSYYDYETKESLEGKVRSIAITNEENFRRFSKLSSTEAFLLSLSHKAGFTDTIEAINDTNPSFIALKLLNRTKEVEEEFLRRILDTTFFSWMLDNYDKYDYKPKALKIYRNYVEIKREYDSYMSQIKSKKISKISFDNFVDIHKRLYDNYLYFVSAFKNELITVKRKYDIEQYDPNKPYCKTYITQNFMNGKVIKLYSTDARKEMSINPLTGEPIEEISSVDVIDDVSNDVPEVVLPENKNLYIDYLAKKKSLKKQYSFLFTMLVLAVIFAIPSIVMVIFNKLFTDGALGNLGTAYKPFLSSYALYIALAAYGLTTLVCLLVLIANKKSQFALKKFNHLVNDIEPKGFVEEEKILYQEEKEKLYKKANKNYTFQTYFLYVFYGILLVFFTTFIYLTLGAFVPAIKISDTINKYYFPFAVGISLGLIYGLFLQKKNKISLIIYSLITVIATCAILFFI